jgi:NAD(P)-dependent dehydrogenase (short-subunit alcohol dehydrogenase family)
MLINLKNRKALVTGGGTGIGKAVVKALAEAGASVAFTSRNKVSITETLNMLNNDINHKGFKVDLSNKKNVAKFYRKITKEFGKIDILINNIGHTLNIKDPFTDIDNWEEVMNINFFTSVNMVNHFIKDMRKKNWGRIVNITSIAGLEISGPSTFNVSKAALTAYTKTVGRSLALEKKNIVMTAFAPGIIMTEKGRWNKKTINSKHAKEYLKHRTALGRFGEMSEITGAIVFLSSDHASFFHSSIIQADGGQSKQYRADTYL